MYFKLGDPMSTSLFIIVLKIVFNLMKQNKDIDGRTFFDLTCLYIAYADDNTLLEDKKSVKQVMNVFDTFSIYSGLNRNTFECGIDDIGFVKGVSVELCGMKCIGMTKSLINILGIKFSYKKKIENKMNFIKLIKKIENVLKIWRLRNLTVQAKIIIFKTLKLSKVINLGLVTNFPQIIVHQLN